MEAVNTPSLRLPDESLSATVRISLEGHPSPPEAGTGEPQVPGGNPPTCHKEDDRLVAHNDGVALNYALVGAIVQDFHGGHPQGEVPGVHLRPVLVPLGIGDHVPL